MKEEHAGQETPAVSASQEKPIVPSADAPTVTQNFFSIDFITRATASVLLFIYGVGFVILGFHDARYGVVQFSPFRARIVLVGLVFTALVGLTIWALNTRTAYWNVLKNVQADQDPERRWNKEFVLMCGFIFSATVIAQLLALFMFASVKYQRPPAWHWAVWVVVYLMLLWVFDYVDRIFSAYPRRAGWTAIIAMAVYLSSLCALFLSVPWAQLSLFIVLVTLQAGLLKLNGPRRHFSSLWSWLNFFLVIWTYITQIFVILPPRWGGGQPTPIQVFQNTPAQWAPSNPVDVLLLDETDQGLYVLLSPGGKAFFVPRSNVASVFFGSKDELPKKP